MCQCSIGVHIPASARGRSVGVDDNETMLVSELCKTCAGEISLSCTLAVVHSNDQGCWSGYGGRLVEVHLDISRVGSKVCSDLLKRAGKCIGRGNSRCSEEAVEDKHCWITGVTRESFVQLIYLWWPAISILSNGLVGSVFNLQAVGPVSRKNYPASNCYGVGSQPSPGSDG